MARVFIGLGANVGEREANIHSALQLLRDSQVVEVVRLSSFKETQPVGMTAQPPFINAVAEIKTGLTPRELLNLVKTTETKLGRTPRQRWGPREIDLDILYYDDLILAEPDLRIPHPELCRREFVLTPLVELAPDFIHPQRHLSNADLLKKLNEGKKNAPDND